MKPSKVTAAVWGPFDEFVLTGHEDGSVSQFDLVNVCLLHTVKSYVITSNKM